MDKGCFQAPRLSPCGICMPLGVFSDQYDHVADESYLEALNLFEQCPALRVPFWRSHVDGTATNSDIQVSSQS